MFLVHPLRREREEGYELGEDLELKSYHLGEGADEGMRWCTAVRGDREAEQ